MNNTTLMAFTILGGLLSAALTLVPIFPIVLLAPLPLFLVGLGLGLRPLYGASLIATALVFLQTMSFSAAAQFFIVFALGPTFLTYKALLKRKTSSGKVLWYPSPLLLRDLTLATAIIMLFALGFYLAQLGDIPILIKTTVKMVDPQNQIKDVELLLSKLIPFLPGFVAFTWAIIMLINATLGQSLLVRLKRNLRPSPSFEDLNVPKSFLILFGLSLFLSMVGVGYLELLGKNTICVLAFPYFLLGLSLVHRWLHKTSFPLAALVIFYIVLLFFLWLAFFIILLGILKPWIEKSISPN